MAHRARSDDWGGDGGLMQQPRQGDVPRLLAEFGAEVLIVFNLRPQACQRFRRPTLEAAMAFTLFLAENATQGPPMERRPRDHPEPEIHCGGRLRAPRCARS